MGTEPINSAISEAQSNGLKIKAIVFGYGDSYILFYGRANTTDDGFGVMFNLKGHYKNLKRDKVRGMSIQVSIILPTYLVSTRTQ